jgi:hypothetical protein
MPVVSFPSSLNCIARRRRHILFGNGIVLTIPHGMATPTISKGTMHLQCAHCAWKEDYAAKDMRRYEVEQITG